MKPSCTHARHDGARRAAGVFLISTKRWREVDDGTERRIEAECIRCDGTLSFAVGGTLVGASEVQPITGG